MTQSGDHLVSEIGKLIIEQVNLHHINPAELTAATNIVQGGLNLDSVDILEVVMAIEDKYGIKVKNADEGQKAFQTLGSISNYVAAQLVLKGPVNQAAPLQSV